MERFRCRVGFHRGLHDCGQIQETRGIKTWKLFFFIGIFWGIFTVFFSTLLHLRPTDSTVSVLAGIESKTVETLALAVSRSNHSAKLHPPAFSMLVQKRHLLEMVLMQFKS